MAFTPNMQQAAHRHHDAALTLDKTSKRPAAAYLFGLAAECAVKALLEAAKVPQNVNSRDDNPYFAHFPKLRDLLIDAIHGRGGGRLAPFAKDDFMTEWDITVRYAHTEEIVGKVDGREKRYDRWKENARAAIAAMEGER